MPVDKFDNILKYVTLLKDHGQDISEGFDALFEVVDRISAMKPAVDKLVEKFKKVGAQIGKK